MKNNDIPNKLYDLIPSQLAMYLMVKYSIHKQLVQVPTSFAIDSEIDFDLLEKAFNIEIERNDCLRLRFLKKGKDFKQYFLDSYKIENIPVKHFNSVEEQVEFFTKDAQKPVLFLKETFRVYFFKTEGVGCGIYLNPTHLILDAMGETITYIDTIRVYNALKDGTEMPKPLAKYEDYIVDEFKRLADGKKMAKHVLFYKKYFVKGGEPMYAGVHGSGFLEKSRKKKHNPALRVPEAYNPFQDKCDFIEKSVDPEASQKILDFCIKNSIAPEGLIQLGLRTYCSSVNYRTPDVFIQSLCSKRATNSEKNMGGCVTQPLQMRTIIPESSTFTQALQEVNSVRTQLFRHAAFPYIYALVMSREIYNYSKTQGPACMMFSWIPVPVGSQVPYKIDFRGYNLGRYFTPLYVICHPDPQTNGLKLNYMYRTKLSNESDINALHENAVKVILAGIENPDITIGELLDSIN